MKPRFQNTIAKPVEFQGRGLFHGIDAKVTLRPADAGTGIVFKRIDLADCPDIPALCEFVATVPRRTVLVNGEGNSVETVEHLMAALAGLQVDNCIVEIDAPEVPAYDGSCVDFCRGILESGLQSLDQTAQVVNTDRKTTVKSSDGKQTLTLRPYVHSCPAFTYHLDYGARSMVSAQEFSIEITPESFFNEIAAARTFVLESEIKALQSMGYGTHLTAKDIVIVGNNGVVDNELRWQNEGVRHKILDCIGDLALSGRAFCGHVTACRSGHHLNHKLAAELTSMKLHSGLLVRAA